MPVVETRKQLSQKRPATVGPTPLYHAPTNGQARIMIIVACNTTALATTFSIYHDKDGQNYAVDTILYSATPLAANSSNYISFEPEGLYLQDSTGYLAAVSGTAGAVNFTVYGIEEITT